MVLYKTTSLLSAQINLVPGGSYSIWTPIYSVQVPNLVQGEVLQIFAEAQISDEVFQEPVFAASNLYLSSSSLTGPGFPDGSLALGASNGVDMSVADHNYYYVPAKTAFVQVSSGQTGDRYVTMGAWGGSAAAVQGSYLTVKPFPYGQMTVLRS